MQYGTYAYSDGSTSRGFAVFHAYADNYAGFIPTGAHYIGGGDYAFNRPKGLPVDNSTDLTFGRRRRIREEANGSIGEIASLGRIPALGPQQPERVKLSGEKLEDYINTRKHLVELLKDDDSDCAKYLKKIVGVSGSRVARTVLAQRPFNGDASTLSLEDAGLLSRNSTDPVTGLPSTAPVNRYFGTRVAGSAQAGFARASTGASFNDVYYVPIAFFEGQILHEALHTLLGSMMIHCA